MTSNIGLCAERTNRTARNILFYSHNPLSGLSTVGEFGSFELILKVAVFDPIDVGLKISFIRNFLPAFTFCRPPMLLTVNIDASVPVIDVDMIRSALP